MVVLGAATRVGVIHFHSWIFTHSLTHTHTRTHSLGTVITSLDNSCPLRPQHTGALLQPTTMSRFNYLRTTPLPVLSAVIKKTKGHPLTCWKRREWKEKKVSEGLQRTHTKVNSNVVFLLITGLKLTDLVLTSAPALTTSVAMSSFPCFAAQCKAV